MSYSVLVADDEPNARFYLQSLLENQSKIETIVLCKSGDEVIRYCDLKSPDILLLDIEMPGLNGLETAIRLKKHSPDIIIIFITAYDHYALEAFKAQAMDYLLKPFSKKQLLQILARAFNEVENKRRAQFDIETEKKYQEAEESAHRITFIEVKEKGFIRKIDLNEIVFFKADSEYSIIQTEKCSFLKRVSLTLLSKTLPIHFLRIHRSYIVNTEKTKTLNYLKNGTYQFLMLNDKGLVSSRSYQKLIQEYIQKHKSRDL